MYNRLIFTFMLIKISLNVSPNFFMKFIFDRQMGIAFLNKNIDCNCEQ